VSAGVGEIGVFVGDAVGGTIDVGCGLLLLLVPVAPFVCSSMHPVITLIVATIKTIPIMRLIRITPPQIYFLISPDAVMMVKVTNSEVSTIKRRMPRKK
jgi:hypothetical protein